VGRSFSQRSAQAVLRRNVATALAKLAYSRRMTTRFETMGDVWVYWSCQGLDDVSSVSDLSLGGLCLSAPVPPPLGAKAKIDFLVQEGQIRTEAVVRHFVPGGGLGLKFTAITDKDGPQLVALLNRVRTLSSTPKAFTQQRNSGKHGTSC
jgi:PilZ domain-containing protein